MLGLGREGDTTLSGWKKLMAKISEIDQGLVAVDKALRVSFYTYLQLTV